MNPTPAAVIDISSDDESHPSEDPNEADENKLSKLKPVKDLDEEKGDDDCLILDGDPYRTDDPATNAAVDQDDVLVIGETGQVACRDYPHSRHLCIKFPFGTALHWEHCDLCHCYVCDSPAPCEHWGTGLHSQDHCHATDAIKAWKTKRASFRSAKRGLVAKASTNIARNSVASCRGQVGRPTAVRACSSPTPVHACMSQPTRLAQMASLAAGHCQVRMRALVRACSSSVPVQKAGSTAGHGQVSMPAAVRACSSSVPVQMAGSAAGHGQVSMPAAVRACLSQPPHLASNSVPMLSTPSVRACATQSTRLAGNSVHVASSAAGHGQGSVLAAVRACLSQPPHLASNSVPTLSTPSVRACASQSTRLACNSVHVAGSAAGHGQVSMPAVVRACLSQPPHLTSNSVPTLSMPSVRACASQSTRLTGNSVHVANSAAGHGQVSMPAAVRACSSSAPVQMAGSAAGHGQVSMPAAVLRAVSSSVPVQMAGSAAGHGQVNMPAVVRACSSTVPSTMSQSKTPRSIDIQRRNGSLPREPALGLHTNLVLQNGGSQFNGSGALSTNRAAFGTNQVQKFVYHHPADYSRNHQPWLMPRAALSNEAIIGSQLAELQSTASSNKVTVGSSSAREVPLQPNLVPIAPPYRIVPSALPVVFQSGEQRTTGSNKVTAREVPSQQNVPANAPPYLFSIPLRPHARPSKVPRIGDHTTNAADSGATTSFGLRI